MRPTPERMFFYICEMKYARMGYARMKVGEKNTGRGENKNPQPSNE